MATRRPHTPIDLRQTPDPSVVQALRQFRLVFNAIKTHFQQIEKRTGMGGAQRWALSVIEQQPGLGTNELAAAMDIHQSTASNLVKALTAKGFIRVERTASDRRSVQLHLEAAGAEVLAAAPGPAAGILPEALGQLDPATLQRLNEDLAALLRVLKPDQRDANVPLGQ